MRELPVGQESPCETCKYARIIPREVDSISVEDQIAAQNLPRQAICIRYPPQIVLMPQQNRITGQTAISLSPQFPSINGCPGCGEYVKYGGDDG